MKDSLLVFALLLASAVAHAQDATGDPESFGRAVVHLGAAQTKKVMLVQNACQKSDIAAGHHCRVLPSDPLGSAGTGSGSIATIELRRAVANSLLCFEYTPSIDVRLLNRSSEDNQAGRWYAHGRVTVHSPVLEDQTILNPATGAPYFNGILAQMQLGKLVEETTLDAAEFENRNYQYTDRCGPSSISKARLRSKEFGLTAAQADAFFANPITLTFTGEVGGRMLTKMDFSYHLRVYGDRR